MVFDEIYDWVLFKPEKTEVWNLYVVFNVVNLKNRPKMTLFVPQSYLSRTSVVPGPYQVRSYRSEERVVLGSFWRRGLEKRNNQLSLISCSLMLLLYSLGLENCKLFIGKKESV